MVKKRLSDLLREEGEKPAAAGEAATVEVATGEVAAGEAATGEKETLGQPLVELSLPQKPAAQAPVAPELEATILQLKQDIAAAQQIAQAAEALSNQQIANLQAKITEQDSQIQQLNAEAEATNQQANQQITQLKAELETARQTILQLSQPKPPQPAARPGATFLGRSQPPTLPSPAVLPSSRAAEPELEVSQSKMIIPERAAKPALSRPKLHELELHKVLDHPTQAGSLPPMSSEPNPAEKESIKLSDADVGWMD